MALNPGPKGQGPKARTDELLFGEAPSRVIISVRPPDAERIAAIAEEESVPLHDLGVVGGDRLTIWVDGPSVDVALVDLRESYEHALDEMLG